MQCGLRLRLTLLSLERALRPYFTSRRLEGLARAHRLLGDELPNDHVSHYANRACQSYPKHTARHDWLLSARAVAHSSAKPGARRHHWAWRGYGVL